MVTRQVLSVDKQLAGKVLKWRVVWSAEEGLAELFSTVRGPFKRPQPRDRVGAPWRLASFVLLWLQKHSLAPTVQPETPKGAGSPTYVSWTTMYWWGMSPSMPLCRPSHQSSEARWKSSREAPFLKDSSRAVRPT